MCVYAGARAYVTSDGRVYTGLHYQDHQHNAVDMVQTCMQDCPPAPSVHRMTQLTPCPAPVSYTHLTLPTILRV